MGLRGTQGHFGVEDLALVRAIGESGSLSAAARRLGIDHSTAFRRLGVLEARLGVRLFERARDGYAPTPAGDAALSGAATLLDGLADLEHRLAGEDLRPTGLLRLTTTDTLVDLVTPVLAGFRRAHPGIRLEIIAANAFLTLTRRDADIAIRPALDPPEALFGRRLAGIATAFYATPDLADRPEAERPWLGPDESLDHLASARWMRRHVGEERVVLRGSSLLVLLAAARAGIGVAPLPCYLADREPGLVRVGGPLTEMESALWLLTHPDLRRTARVRAFLDFAGDRLAALRPELEGG